MNRIVSYWGYFSHFRNYIIRY